MSTHIIILAQAKELANLRRPLRPQPLRQHLIRQARDLLIPLLHHAQRQDRQIHRDDATPHALPLALPGPPGPVAAVARAQQQADPRRVHDALLHGEALLVVAAGDAEDVALELRADAVALDFLAHAFLHEAAQLALVFDLDELLGAVGRVGDVELHPDGLGGGGWVGTSRWLEVDCYGWESEVELGFSPSETLCELRCASGFIRLSCKCRGPNAKTSTSHQ